MSGHATPPRMNTHTATNRLARNELASNLSSPVVVWATFRGHVNANQRQ